MGLHIHNLGGIPVDTDRRYFVYILDYGWKEPLTDTLVQNFTNMARQAAETESVVVAGIDPIHFANQVFSWHGINGEDGESVLPAIMVTSLHPEYFKEENNGHGRRGEEIRDKMLLIPLKEACNTTEDVISLIQSVFADIRGEKSVLSFKVAKELKKDDPNRAMDALMLEPNFMGLGIRIPQALKWITSGWTQSPKGDESS